METNYVNPLRHAIETETERLEGLEKREAALSKRYNKIRAPHSGASLALRIFYLGVIIGTIKPFINTMTAISQKIDDAISAKNPDADEIDNLVAAAPSAEAVSEKIQRAINYIVRTADFKRGYRFPSLKTFQLAKADVDWNREGRKGPVFVTKRLPTEFNILYRVGHTFTKPTKSKTYTTRVRKTPVVQTPKVIDHSKVRNARIRDTISHVEKVLRDGGCVKRKQNLAIHGTAHCHWCDSLLKEQKNVDATILHIRNRAAENEEIHEKALEIARESEGPEVVKDLIRTLADCRGFRKAVNKEDAAEALRIDPEEMEEKKTEGGYKSRKPREVEQAYSLRDVQRIAQEEGWDNEAMSRIPGTDAYRTRRRLERMKPKEEVKQEEAAPEPKKPRRKLPTHRRKIEQIAS
jgi:hypothetical protein